MADLTRTAVRTVDVDRDLRLGIDPADGCIQLTHGRAGLTGIGSFRRRASAAAALGLVGVASLLLQPVSPEIRAQIPLAAQGPTMALRALLALNPAILVLVAALIGAMLAHRVCLRSIAAGTAAPDALGRVLAWSTAAGLALGLGLAWADMQLLPHMDEGWQRLAANSPGDAPARIVGLLYGGLAEEVMLRWGLMSLVAWGLSSLLGGRHGGVAMALAIVVAAGIFGAAHLPALAAQTELTPLAVARTLLLNGVAGVLYGWLFWRHHLEAAMAAHAATHLGMWAWRGLAA